MTKMMDLSEDLLDGILSRVPLNSTRAVRSTCKARSAFFYRRLAKTMEHSVKVSSEEARDLGESRMIMMMDHNVYLTSVVVTENPSTKCLGKHTCQTHEQVKLVKMSTISCWKFEEKVCDDMISALPEDLLIRILMLIPTKEAVATMILSKTWRYVWKMLPTLDYKENNDDDRIDNCWYYYYDDADDYDENKKSVWWFLNKSLELHNAPILETLLIKLGPQCPTDADVGKWVAKAVGRGVRMLRLKLGWLTDPTKLPESLYTCQTLKTLTLSYKVLVDLPSSSWLPSLTVLELFCVTYKDSTSLVRLLSSCPILENLAVKRKKEDNAVKFSIKVPTLQLLSYDNDDTSLVEENDLVHTGRCLVMNTPALKSFDITDYSGDFWSIENMPCLEAARIDVDDYSPNSINYLTLLSSILSLELCLNTDQMIMCFSTIQFSRLTKCKIVPCDSDWMDSLVPLLQNTPKLKSLTVDYRSTHQPPIASASWCTMSHSNVYYYYPECLHSSLEKFELIDYTGRKEENELVEYILITAMCLKIVTISLRHGLPTQDKETMMGRLEAMSKLSTSPILFKS